MQADGPPPRHRVSSRARSSRHRMENRRAELPVYSSIVYHRRRTTMKSRIVLVLSVGISFGVTAGRAETAARQPAAGAASAVLAPAGESGQPLIVEGRVVSGDKNAPVANAELLVYHTDATGCYSLGCRDERNPGARSARLQGKLRTDAQGRYELRTIKPGQYPGSGPPAHIHYELTIGEQPMKSYELIFEGDSRLTSEIRARAARHDFYILCTPVKDPDGTLRCRSADVIVQ
jgi:hypothetical protein